MSVYRDEYLVKGFKLSDEQIEEIKRLKGEKYLWDLEDIENNKCWLLVDGMSGEYSFFGICIKLNDGFESENTSITEVKLEEADDEKITNKFAEIFGDDEDIPEIKLYHVPHYH